MKFLYYVVTFLLILTAFILAIVFNNIKSVSILGIISTLISLFSLFLLIVTSDTMNKWNFRVYIVSLILGIIFLIISFITGMSIYYTEDKDKKDDKKDDKKGLLTSHIILLILSIIFIGGILLFIIYLLFSGKLKMNFFQSLLMIMGILTIGTILITPFICLIIGKKSDKDEDKKSIIIQEAIDSIKLSQTDLRDKNAKVPENILKQIIKNLKNFYIYDECKSNKSKSCNYLFEQLTQNKDFTYAELNNILDSMEKDALVNQSVYLIYQIAQCKLQLKDIYKKVYEFGTLEWWKTNIWGDLGGGKVLWFQRFIWIISFVIMGMFILYLLFELFKPKSKIFEIFGMKNFVWKIYSFIFLFITIIFYLVGYFYKTSGETYDIIDIPKKLKKYIGHYTKDDEKKGEKTRGWIFGTLIIFTIIFSLLTFFIKNIPGWSNLFKSSTVALWLSLVLSFNLYYTFLIPQLLIIGIFLQRYILSNSITSDNITTTIIKFIILIAVIFASLFDTTYTTGDISNEEKKEHDVTKVSGITSSYNKPIWFMFGILITMYILNFVETIYGNNPYGDYQWSLLFMPFLRYILNFITGSNAGYIDMSVSNSI